MKLNPEACTFCQREVPYDVPEKWSAITAHGAHGLKNIYFCSQCQDLIPKLDESDNEFIRQYKGDRKYQYQTKDELRKAYTDGIAVCIDCNVEDNKATDWTLCSPDDQHFFFICAECSKNYRAKQKLNFEKFIEEHCNIKGN
jgi:hypothetical protein